MKHMKMTMLTTATVVGLAAAGAYANQTGAVSLIENIDDYDNQNVVISGVVSSVDDNGNFTLQDNTGDVEVNLAQNRNDLQEGDFVTVSGVVDASMMGDELQTAQVTVRNSDYNSWSNSYQSTYGQPYNLGGMDADFRNEVSQNEGSNTYRSSNAGTGGRS